MFHRILKPLLSNSFFLFGARGTGKSTLLRTLLPQDSSTLWIDLLDLNEEDAFAKNHKLLEQRIEQQELISGVKLEWVVIDEVQKLPRLLDTVHKLIERTKIKFALTGSSARKLKAGAANLLAGRAFVNNLFPLSYQELNEQFSLQEVLNWGSLPFVAKNNSQQAKAAFLRTYAQTYLKEEVWAEQLVRKLEPFRKFLEVAAHSNGKVVSFANIATDVGVDEKTIKTYYTLLEDTLLGFFLEAFKHSFRKRLSQKPKFLFFDAGVARALTQSLTAPLVPKTSAYGEAFEHFVILEFYKQSLYLENDFRFSYLCTKDGVEVDLVVERPGKPLALIEIKSSNEVHERMLVQLNKISLEIDGCEAFCLCQETVPRKVGNVQVLNWRHGIQRVLGLN